MSDIDKSTVLRARAENIFDNVAPGEVAWGAASQLLTEAEVLELNANVALAGAEVPDTSARRYTLDEDPESFTLAEFCAVNQAVPSWWGAAIDALTIGGSVLLGGGASASFTLTRVS